MKSICSLIRQKYQTSRGDSTELFETILSVAAEIGLDQALACLEKCVTEKRLLWLQNHLKNYETTGDPLQDGYRLFYEIYLRVSVPEDGVIIERTGNKIVMRWWNRCPTLEACRKFGLDTRQICKQAYHKPVQEFLSKVHPNLKFDRNYEALRPYTAYCEEIISLNE